MKLLQRARDFKQDMKERGKLTLANKIGMTFVEIVILISIILVIAVTLFVLRGRLVDLMQSGNNYVSQIIIPNENTQNVDDAVMTNPGGGHSGTGGYTGGDNGGNE